MPDIRPAAGRYIVVLQYSNIYAAKWEVSTLSNIHVPDLFHEAESIDKPASVREPFNRAPTKEDALRAYDSLYCLQSRKQWRNASS
jgi:hypothetical protein